MKHELVSPYRAESQHDRHDIHVDTKINFYAPIILWIGTPLLAVGLFIFGVYVHFFWAQFVALTGYLPLIVGLGVGVPVLILVAFAVVRIYHKIGDARQVHALARGAAMRASIVLAEQEIYTLIRQPTTGAIELLQPIQDQYRYTIKVPEQALLTEASTLPQLSGRDLVASGQVDRALAAGKYLLGYDEAGKIKEVPQEDLYNLLLAGIPGSGKSTTGVWLGGQRVKAGGLYMVSDPHLYYQDERGRQSLGSQLAPYTTSMLMPTDDGSVPQVLAKLSWMLRELAKRQKPGYVVRVHDNWLWIMDEFNSIIDAMDEAGKSTQFATGLALLQREGRKFGLHTMIMGHRFSRDDIGKVKIRSVASNILSHKMTDAQQAKVLIGSKGSKAVDLSVGDYLLSGILATTIERIHTPLFEATDMPLLFGRSGSIPDAFPGRSQPIVDADPAPSGMTGNEAGKHPELHSDIMGMMRKMVGDEATQSEIVNACFPGMRNADAVAQYRKYMAVLVRNGA